MDRERLLEALRDALPAASGIDALDRLSGGASQQTWAIAVRRDDGHAERVVLRLAAVDATRRSRAALALGTEAALIREAAAHGVPVPAVLAVLDPATGSDHGLGEGFFMRHVDGETLPRRILRESRYAAARERLAAQCGAALARVHAMPRSPVVASLRTADAAGQLEHYADESRRQGTERPVLELAIAWLADRLPAPHAPRLMHGDFRMGNLMVGDDGLRAVLDWELAHLGDPAEDLGWLCVASWRFGVLDRPVGGFASREALYAAYEAAGGAPVDAQRVRWWEVMGSLKWCVMCGQMLSLFRDGSDASIERAVIGRRASEAELDLLWLLDPVGPPPGLADALRAQAAGPSQAETRGDTSSDPPAARELLDAVARFLREAAAPGLAGHPGFLARVAANALEIARREIALGPAADAAHRARLAQLLDVRGDIACGTLDAALCERLRARTVDATTPGLLEHLWSTTLAKVAIDQPGYASFRAALSDAPDATASR